MKAIWKTIPSAPDYEASSLGDVRRRRPGLNQKTTKPLSVRAEKNGYLRVRIWIGGRGKNLWLHRAVCEAFHGLAPTARHQAAHADGVRSNCRSDNLSWKTRKENYQDSILHGTSKRGEGNHMARLTPDHVRQIRARYRKGMSATLAAEFGVTPGTINSIAGGRLWTHL